MTIFLIAINITRVYICHILHIYICIYIIPSQLYLLGTLCSISWEKDFHFFLCVLTCQLFSPQTKEFLFNICLVDNSYFKLSQIVVTNHFQISLIFFKNFIIFFAPDTCPLGIKYSSAVCHFHYMAYTDISEESQIFEINETAVTKHIHQAHRCCLQRFLELVYIFTFLLYYFVFYFI